MKRSVSKEPRFYMPRAFRQACVPAPHGGLDDLRRGHASSTAYVPKVLPKGPR